MHPALLLPALVLVQAPAPAPAPDPDAAAIRATVEDYLGGFYAGDTARMERALHPDLAKRIAVVDPKTGKGRVDHMSAMKLVQITRSGAGTKIPAEQRRMDFTLLDRTGNAATAKAVAASWVDYLHLVKLDGRWVIVNVLWETTGR